MQPAGGDEILDGARFGQTRIAGNGWDGREAGAVLVAPLAEVEIDGYRAGREVLLVEYPALPQRYSSASPFHRQLEQHGRVSVVTFGNNKFGQTPAIVLRGGCPYLFHCLRFQPQGEPDFVFYSLHDLSFPTSFRPRNKTVSDIAARHRRGFRKLPKTPRKPPFRSVLPDGVTPPRTRTTPRLSPAYA